MCKEDARTLQSSNPSWTYERDLGFNSIYSLQIEPYQLERTSTCSLEDLIVSPLVSAASDLRGRCWESFFAVN